MSCAALGVRISMDDFGTGYSSLSYLRSFPFDKIKIDRSFVHNLTADADSMAIIRAVAGLGSSLGMATTGEGVETQEELDYLKSEGCTEAQGYFFSRPQAGERNLQDVERHGRDRQAGRLSAKPLIGGVQIAISCAGPGRRYPPSRVPPASVRSRG